MTKKYLLILAALAFTSIAHAEDKSRGCGPFNNIAPKNTMISTSTRATSEYYLFPLNWSATSSGTSGCKKHEIVKHQEKAYEFAINNYEDLKSEIAKGHGEHLVSLAASLGCSADATPAFSNALKQNYEKLMPSYKSDSDDFFRNAVNFLNEDSFLRSNCKNLTS